MNPVVKYFNGEKLQCSIGVVVSLLSIAIALYFLFNFKKPFYNGISYPFLIIPFLLLMICIAVIMRSPRDIQRVNDMLENNHEKIKTEELPRMDKVMKNFTVLKWIEIGLAGVGLVFFLAMPSGSFWKGVGAGLFIQSVLMFLFDVIAAARGKVYWDFLRSLSN